MLKSLTPVAISAGTFFLPNFQARQSLWWLAGEKRHFLVVSEGDSLLDALQDHGRR